VNLASLLARAQRTLDAIERRHASRAASAARSSVAPVARPQCGARCRDGHPCAAPAVWSASTGAARNGRCRMHGGLSTGPRTPDGRARVAAATRAANVARWSTSRA
jgi:hypothetical protein